MKSFASRFWRSAAVAGAVSAFLAIVVPLQTYLANRADYGFGLSRLLLECCCIALVLVLASLPLLLASERWLGGFLTVAVTAFAVCAYLETGFLSLGLPELNGGPMPTLDSTVRGVWDAALLAAVFLALTIPFRKIRGLSPWIALGVLVLGGASLLDVRKGEASGPAASGSDFHSFPAILDGVKYSKERNVLVFVLDSLPATLAHEVLDANPDIRASFQGFAAYDNVGMEDRTSRGIPGLMTGRYFEADSDPGASQVSIFGPESFLTTYAEAGAAVYSIAVMLPYGYANRPCPDLANEMLAKREREALVLREPSTEVPYLTVMNVTQFRLLPFALKKRFIYPKIQRRSLTGSGEELDFHHEHVMFPKLARAGFLDGTGLMLGVFHSWGSHFPAYFDAEGKPLAKPSAEYSAIRTETANALRHLARLLEAYRRNGIYDKSLIVVTADHGCYVLPHPEGRDPRESVALLVKPEGAKGQLAFADIPTSSCRVASLVKRAVGEKLSRAEIDGILRTERRRFQSMVSRGVFREWTIGPRGEVLSVRDWKNTAVMR